MTKKMDLIPVNAEPEIVQDRAQTRLSDLWQKEDYWAIWLGFFLLLLGTIIFLPNKPEGMNQIFAKSNTIMEQEAERSPFKTIAFFRAQDAKEAVKARDQQFAKKISSFLATPGSWKSDFTSSFYMSQEQADTLNAAGVDKYELAKTNTAKAFAAAQAAERAAAEADFANATLNETAVAKIDDWRKRKGPKALPRKASPINRTTRSLHSSG